MNNRLFFRLTRDVHYAHTDSWDAIYRMINASVDYKLRGHVYFKTNVVTLRNRQITQHVNATHTTHPKT